MKLRCAARILNVFFFLSLVGCGDSDSEGNRPRQGAAGAQEAEKNTKVVIRSVEKYPTTKGKYGWSLFRKRDRHFHKKYTTPAIDTFWRGDYEKLEAMAAEYRSEKTLRNDGGRALDSFYTVFEDYSDINQVNPERYYPKMERMLKEWQEKFPDSPTPHTALAGFYVGYAWFARGSGYSNSVSEEGWKLFAERLQKAEKVGVDFPLAKQDVYFHRAMLRAGLGLGRPVEQIEGIFAEGRKVDPEYWGLYKGVAYYLLPRWYGEDHREWQSWLTIVLDEAEISDDLKDEFYAQVCLSLISLAYDSPDDPNMFEAAGVDWERLKRGAETLMEKFPESTKIPSRYLRASVQAEDYEVGSSIVERMNFVFDGMEWWGHEAYEFYEVVKLLEEEGAGKKGSAPPPE